MSLTKRTYATVTRDRLRLEQRSGALTTDKLLLYKAKMEKANLVNSDLSGVALVGVNFRAANLGCDPKGQCSDLSQSDLRGANLQDAIIRGADLRKTYFTKGANLPDTDIKDADIQDAHFEGAITLEGFLSLSSLPNRIISVFRTFYKAELSVGNHH